MATYRAHSMTIHTAGISAVHVRDILSMNFNVDPELRAEVTAANFTPDHVAMVARRMLFSTSTYDLKQLLDTIGATGLCITTDGSHPGVTGYLQKCDDCGVAASGSVHRSYLFTLGLIVPRRITCQHRGDARLDYDIVVIGDGTNAPVTLSDTAALPTITASPLRFTLGPCKLNNVALTEYSEIEIDFGNQVQTRGSESDIDDTHIEQKTHEPMIRIKGIDPAWFSASKVPAAGVVVANSTDYVYLRKRAQTASHFVADGTAEHIKFTLAGFAAVGNAVSAELQRVSETEVVIKGAKDASGNMPIVVSTSSAIS